VSRPSPSAGRRGASLLAGLAAFLGTTAVSAAEYTTGLRYDALRRLTGMIEPDPDDSGPLPFPALRYTWSSDGHLASIEKGTLPAWQGESVAPSAWANFTVQQKTAFSYDARGMQTETRITSGASVFSATQFTYDADGRLACSAIRMNLAAIPAAGSDACAQGSAGGADRITQNIYDVATQLLQTRRGVDTALEQAYVTHTYTPNGDLEDVIDAGGNRAEMAYDAYGRKEQWRFPSPTKPAAFDPSTPATAVATAGPVNAADYEQWTYDANDNVTVDRKRDGREIVLTYDNLDRRQTRRYRTAGVDEPAANWVFYDYDLRGLQESAAFGSVAGPGIANLLDNAGRLTRSTDTTGGASRALNYLYDSASNRIRITHPDAAYFTYEYDALNRVTAVRESGATALVTIGYDDSGDRASLGRANGATTTYSYDPISRLQSLAQDLAGTAQDVTFGFSYNAGSQIVTRTRSNDLYAYRPQATSSQAYVPNGLNQYASIGGTAFDYDSNGNLESDGASSFTYDVENRLLGASGARTATLSYDPRGRLYRTQGASGASAIRLLYDGNQLVSEYDPAGALLRRYVHGPGGDEPLVWYEGSSLAVSGRRFLHADHHGTIVAITDQGGGAIALNRFDPWGVAAAGHVGRFSYTGQIVIPELAAAGDAATAMLHYKARTYAPQWGRFLQTDRVGYVGEMNLYAYIGNDPLNGVDASGLCRRRKKDGTCDVRNRHKTPETLAEEAALEGQLNVWDQRVNATPDNAVIPILDASGNQIGTMTGKRLKEDWNATSWEVVPDDSVDWGNEGKGWAIPRAGRGGKIITEAVQEYMNQEGPEAGLNLFIGHDFGHITPYGRASQHAYESGLMPPNAPPGLSLFEANEASANQVARGLGSFLHLRIPCNWDKGQCN
jgi:RHS repeat-associated protein